MYDSIRANKEAGIALIVAAFVGLILICIAFVYIVSSSNIMAHSNLSQGKVRTAVVAEIGLERALWYIQHQYDVNPGFVPQEGSLFGDYDRLIVDYRDDEIVSKYGMNVLSMGPNARYAVKLRWEKDGNNDNGDELAVYAVAVDKIVGRAGKSVAVIDGMKMLLRVGARERGLIEAAIVSGGKVMKRNNTMWQGKGNIYSEGGFEDDVQYENPGDEYELLRPTGDDDFIVDTDIVVQAPEDVPIQVEEIDEPNKKVRIERTQKSIPEFNVSDFATPKGDYKGPDYTLNDLLNKNWRITGDALVCDNDHFINIWEQPPLNSDGTLDRNNEYIEWWMDYWLVSEENILEGMYYDRNGDGYTVIYIPDTAPNLRILPYKHHVDAVFVLPGARAIIASEGRGSNLWRSESEAPDGRIVRNGMKIGVDREENTNVGVEIRGNIWTTKDKSPDMAKMAYQEKNTGLWRTEYHRGDRFLRERMENWGVLSIFAENDVILSALGSAPDVDIDTGADPISVFRGMVYSGGTLRIQTDILIQGMLIGRENVDFVDIGSLTEGLYGYADGNDTVFYYENPLQPSENDREFFPEEFAPLVGGQADTRKMYVLSWERGKFCKE
jgi:hypothetical protein